MCFLFVYFVEEEKGEEGVEVGSGSALLSRVHKASVLRFFVGSSLLDS